MLRNMDIYRLNQEKLKYELAIRGTAPGTCEEMRKVLAKAKKLEKTGDSFTYPEHPYTIDQDARAVEKCLRELSLELDQLREGGVQR